MTSPPGIGARTEELQHFIAVLRVQVIGRLVEQADGRVLCQQRGDLEPPALAARERRDVARGEFREPDRGERRIRAREVLGAFPLPEWQVRVAPDQRRVEHGGWERILGRLRQQREPARALAAGPRSEVAAVECDAARGRRAKSSQRVQGQRLADAIAAEHRDEFAAPRLERERADERAAVDRDVEAGTRQPRPAVAVQGCSRWCCHGRVWLCVPPENFSSRVQRTRSCSRCSPSTQSSTAAAHR